MVGLVHLAMTRLRLARQSMLVSNVMDTNVTNSVAKWIISCSAKRNEFREWLTSLKVFFFISWLDFTQNRRILPKFLVSWLLLNVCCNPNRTSVKRVALDKEWWILSSCERFFGFNFDFRTFNICGLVACFFRPFFGRRCRRCCCCSSGLFPSPSYIWSSFVSVVVSSVPNVFHWFLCCGDVLTKCFSASETRVVHFEIRACKTERMRGGRKAHWTRSVDARPSESSTNYIHKETFCRFVPNIILCRNFEMIFPCCACVRWKSVVVWREKFKFFS